MPRTGRPKVEKVSVQCAGCDQPIYRYPSDFKRAKTRRFFCSECSKGRFGLKPHTGAMVPCAVCKSDFYRRKHEEKRDRQYCSVACHNIAQKKPSTTRPCKYCGKTLELKPSESGRWYCTRACYEQKRGKRQNGRMHNGRPVLETTHGYLTVYAPDHPNKWKDSQRIFEHRAVVENDLGRYLTPDEQVDHINGIKNDNRLENLQVLSVSDHSKKTNGDKKAKALTLLETLAEYERRFGPLE